MTDSRIITGPGGITFAGKDAVQAYRAIVLRSALAMLDKGIIPTRGMTKRKALTMAAAITGRFHYRNTQIEEARADLQVWIDAMKLELPVERREG